MTWFMDLIRSQALLESWFLFIPEIVIAEALFVFWMPKRVCWHLRLAVFAALLIVAAIFWPDGWTGPAGMLLYLLLYLSSVIGIAALYQCSWRNALFCGIAGYATQHIANGVCTILLYVWLGRIDSFASYKPVLFLFAYVSVYTIVYSIFAKRIKNEGFFGADNPVFSIFLIFVLTMVVVLNYCAVYYVPWDGTGFMIAHLLLSLYSVVGSIFSLFMLAGLHRQSRLSESLAITQQLIHNQEKQYQISEETINTINLKCHDLKHQLTMLRRHMDDPDARAALEEIEESALIYDSVIKTGNPALDVILTEKSLLCERNHIQLTCMVDADGFVAIRDPDLYSIFGNLLDNAIESVLGMEEPGQRTIGLTVTTMGEFLIIHTENYFCHPVTMQDGLPVTTKEDTRYHGFGMKSIQLLVSQYGGTLSIIPDDNIFNVDIMIPLTSGEQI